MNTTDSYRFVFTGPLPLVVDGGKTLWRLSAVTYGKGHGRMEVIAQCLNAGAERIVIADGRESAIVREYRLGMLCQQGTMLDRIVRKLVREGRAEVIDAYLTDGALE